jgi:alpha-L-fucosidase 2
MVYYARLLKGDLALRHLRGLISDATEANLLTFSAGGVAGAVQNIYSFDGNAGAAAGIAEMLLQSDGVQIELLPALPASWRDGSVRGLRARGGFTVDLSWRDGRLDRARIVSALAAKAIVRYDDAFTSVWMQAGETVQLG